jgi:hypothetical protein
MIASDFSSRIGRPVTHNWPVVRFPVGRWVGGSSQSFRWSLGRLGVVLCSTISL